MAETLYDLTEELVGLESALESMGGDFDALTEEEQERFVDLIDLNEAKVEGYYKLHLGRQAQIKALKEEVARLTAKKKTVETQIAHQNSRLYTVLKLRGLKKIETSIGNVGYRAMGQGSIELLVDIEDLPEEFTTVVPEVTKADLKALRDAIKAADEGDEVLDLAKINDQVEKVYFK